LTSVSAAPGGSPEAVVAKALDAMHHGRVSEFIQALHPGSLKEFRTSILELQEASAGKGHPEALTEAFKGVADAAELKKLDAPAMLTARLAEITSSAQIKEAWNNTRVEAVGSLPDGRDGAYVVCRSTTTIGDAMLQRLSVVLARKSGDEWKLTLPEEFTSELALMKQSIADDARPPDFAATKFQPLGHVMDGKDAAMVVYKMETPMGSAVLSRIGVLRAAPEDPEWNAVLKDDKDAVRELLRRKVSLPQASDSR
jgi:hypothetical protein